MATGNKSKANNDKKRRQYLPHNRPVKKGKYALQPGVQGFFITCDGGRERQASNEAINVIDSFYEELVSGTETTIERAELSMNPLNKVTKFTYSDSSSSDDDDNDEDSEDDHDEDESNVRTKEEDNKPAIATGIVVNNENPIKEELGNQREDDTSSEKEAQENKEKTDDQEVEAVEPSAKKQCTENDAFKCRNDISNKIEKKSVDRLIEDELAELGDRSKRRFSNLDSGCNGVVFVQMRKRDGDPSPKDIVQHMMTSLASTRKHVSSSQYSMMLVQILVLTEQKSSMQLRNPFHQPTKLILATQM
ncbi:nucleolin 1-like isoform X2 [Olea europaea var. sylvestris]|uniref:THUMP domain-containing protein n=1 Tax=Olea europaea subsp. europaea TaxID=158383 RepID=A0A8S0TLC3_OLEEU|nr:nucleolin 1-like isoform X2 [Olea europaea var. sylvestris]CAA3006137.1 Hypothetical predicted protein [Olea europaea subsp. europaea]